MTLSFHPADGFTEQLGGILALHLLLDVSAVDFHGSVAQVELVSDLAGGQSLPDQIEDFLLAVRQGIDPEFDRLLFPDSSRTASAFGKRFPG